MKKLLCCLFAFCLLLASASAETFDLTKMSDADLKSLRDQIDEELANRNQAKENEVIQENDNFRAVLVSSVVEGRKITLTIEWTNLSAKADDLHWNLDAQAFADGVSTRCSKTGFLTEIRPGVTYTATVECTAPDGAKVIDIDFTSWGNFVVYKTYTFDLR